MNLFNGSGAPIPDSSGPHGEASLVSPIRAVSLPESFAAEIRESFEDYWLERLLLARAAYLECRADSLTADVRKALIHPPANGRPDDLARRKHRRVGGAFRGQAADIWRRIFKQAVPSVETKGKGEFQKMYAWVRRVIQQSDHVIVRGPMASGSLAQSPNRLMVDIEGRRLPLSKELEAAAQGRLAPTQPLCARCTGPKPSGSQGLWGHVEKWMAHHKNMHRSFTETISSPQVDGDRRPADAPRFETQVESSEARGSRQIRTARWRQEEAPRRVRKPAQFACPGSSPT